MSAVGLCVLLALFGTSTYISGCLVLEPKTEKHAQYISPDGRHVAVVYSVDGGATGSHNVYVRIMSSEEKLTLDDRTGDVLGVKAFDPKIEVVWRDNRGLSIRCPNCSSDDAFIRKDVWSDISIKYE